MSRAVFLDRDGVINRAVLRGGRPYPPSSLEELEFLPGAGEAIARLREVRFRVIVVTNQPDVAAGTQRREMVEAINEQVRREFRVDDVKVCYHSDRDRCNCRKPKPGMLLDAADQWDLNLPQSFMVGDRWRDIEAGRAAGCKTVLIDYGYAERRAESPDAVVRSLLEASVLIRSNRL